MSDELTWKKLASRDGPQLPLFRVRFDLLQHPTSDRSFERLVLQAPDWVNVAAITDDGRIVMVEQYRFGVEALTLEPVGGLVDAGEDSLAAAQRELAEETGFGGGDWRYLGAVQANPAIHDNLCHMWLAQRVTRQSAPSPDDGEAIRVHLMSLDEVQQAVADQRFMHPLGLAALSRVFPLWELPDDVG